LDVEIEPECLEAMSAAGHDYCDCDAITFRLQRHGHEDDLFLRV
jgi:hypothetical protein